MRRKPIEKPNLYGCATCGSIPGIVLTDEKTFYPGGVHIMSVTIDDYSANLDEENEGINVSGINEGFKDKLANCQFAEMFHMTPLHDETYEYNTDDGKWYLVEQGQGYA